MELEKIRNLSDEELLHQEKTASEQLFRLRFQVSLGQNDGVKKLRQLRKEIAQVKTVARERELGIRGATHEAVPIAAEPVAKKSAKKTVRKSAKKTVKKSAKKSVKKSAKKSVSAKANKTSAKKGAGK